MGRRGGFPLFASVTYVGPRGTSGGPAAGARVRASLTSARPYSATLRLTMYLTRARPRTRAARRLRCVIRVALGCAATVLVPVAALVGQGVTTAMVRGTVRSPGGVAIDEARVSIVNTATGFTISGQVRRGRFVIPGLEIGGPYTVTIRKLGYHPEQRSGVFLGLDERLELPFVLRATAIPLDTQRVVSLAPLPQSSRDGGTATTITGSLLQRVPTLNRDMYDLLRLVPQVSTRTGFRTGFSGGGVGLRYNNYLINGVSERSPYFNASAAFGGGRSVPLGAVKEYQVLLAPYDVRYGDFAGALINTVTRAGTNRFEGSAFAYARSDRLARSDSVAPYERALYGFSLGGPLLRDRLHFFVAPEFQHSTSPAAGPYVGQPVSADVPVPVAASDLTRLDAILRPYGLTAGSGGLVENRNPLAHLFARLDFAMPAWHTRAVLWTNHSRFSSTNFSRAAVADSFLLSTWQSEPVTALRFTSLQLQTALPGLGGAHNEFVVSYNVAADENRSAVQQPIVRVAVAGATGDRTMLITGTRPPAQGLSSREQVIQISDNLTLPVGSSHLLTLGFAAAPFRYDRTGVMGSYGTWTFSSMDSLERGVVEQYQLRRDFGSGSVPIGGTQYSMYAGDRWLAGDRVVITAGVRADLFAIHGRAPYNREIDTVFQRRTDEMPRRRADWSPRIGFTWDVVGTGRDQLRGGVGLFTGRPPATWLHSALANYGIGIGALTCGAGGTGPAPIFVPNHRTPPTACTNGSGFGQNPRGDVELLDPQLQMVRTLRGSGAWDRRLPWDLVVTGEVMLTRNLSDYVFMNLNLAGPQGIDRNGRILYGTIDTAGTARPAARLSGRSVIDLVNTSSNYSYQLSARLEKRFTRGTAATASYTYSRVRDVSTPVRTAVPGVMNWSARAISGRQDDMRAGISLNDVPHRVILAGNYRAPWVRWPTELSFYYVGESGSPFTYVARGGPRRGDLNADGSNVNDPIYVPRSARDSSEIRFVGGSQEIRSQQEAFDRFIDGASCLRRQRGRIMARNSCREPWGQTTVASARQAVPIAGHTLETELQVFNVLNLLRSDWGLPRVAYGRSDVNAVSPLLVHVNQTGGPAGTAQSEFQFDVTTPRWDVQGESVFQLQVALRYRF